MNTTDHSLYCNSIMIATDNLTDDGSIHPDVNKSVTESDAEDALVQRTASEYVEDHMTFCDCR